LALLQKARLSYVTDALVLSLVTSCYSDSQFQNNSIPQDGGMGWVDKLTINTEI
jgi:hypothetical protein